MILIIDNYDSFTHNLFQYLSELTDEEVRVVRNDQVSIAEIAKLRPSRIVISPGPGRPEDAGVSIEVVRQFAGRVPILGVCLGHQAIGAAFDADIVSAARIVHGKAEPIEIDGRGLFRSINTPSDFTRYHSLAVAESSLSSEFEISARAVDGEIMGIRHKQHIIEGVQFHPESIASASGKKLLSNFLHYRREKFDPRDKLNRLLLGTSLSQSDAAGFMEELTDGNLSDAQVAAFLIAFTAKGVTDQELAGCTEVLQRKRTPIRAAVGTLDTCGTGGDGLGTFNISSLSALVAAGGGARVAKHGNRAVSSRSGSADFYRAMGINIDARRETVERSLQDVGFAFLYAPKYHAAMRFAGPARREIGVKTIMNLVGPLANPAGASYQLIGVFDARYLEVVARAAVRLGVKRGMVVHGLDGQDELSVTAPTEVVEFAAAAGDLTGDEAVDAAEFEHFVLQPENYGLSLHAPESLKGGSAEENAAVARRLLAGEDGRGGGATIVDAPLAALHDSVVLNAGAALAVAGAAETITSGTQAAAAALRDGAAQRVLMQAIAISTGEDDG